MNERLYPVETYLPTTSVEDIVFQHLGMKINAIKALRETFDLGLREAKEMVETAMPILETRVAKWEGAKAIMRVNLATSGRPLRVHVNVRELVSSTEVDVVPGEDTPIYRVSLMDLELLRG